MKSIDAAKALCKAASWNISPDTLQKLLYLANLKHIHQYGEPLIDESFRVGDFTVREDKLYRACEMFGASPVKPFFLTPSQSKAVKQPTLEQATSISIVLRLYGTNRAKIVAAIQGPGSVWQKKYPGNKDLNLIFPDDLKADADRLFSISIDRMTV